MRSLVRIDPVKIDAIPTVERDNGSPPSSEVAIPLQCESAIPVVAGLQPVTVGVPLAKGQIVSPVSACFSLADGQEVSVQTRVLGQWADGSVKWLLCDFMAPELPTGLTPVGIRVGMHQSLSASRSVVVRESGRSIMVDTGAAEFEIDRATFRPFAQVRVHGRAVLASEGGDTSLTDRKGRLRHAIIESYTVEETGPVRTTLCFTGSIERCRGLRFRARLSFFVGSGLVRLRFTLHNSRRARHRGGLWDLGDPGSFLFRDLSVKLALPSSERTVAWRNEPGDGLRRLESGDLELYQASSGGENWQSRNHVNRHGKVPCQFRGYRIRTASGEEFAHRANPVVAACHGSLGVAVAVPEFWQQFPKAIEVNAERLSVGLFPRQWEDDFELQGGEQKTHTVWLRFGDSEEASADSLDWTQHPLRVCATPEWYAESGAIPYLSPASRDADGRLESYLEDAISGAKSFFAGREVIDEYGWRNYGDVWANHEEAYYRGPKPVISHYNNQFDLVYGAILQWMRTGDSRWADVFDPLARHVIDIDIYHTREDRSVYNGGLFWFTDHYLDAGTSTHRTYSRKNAPGYGGAYGGGPGSEHNFASGLRYYHYLTGDPDAREAVTGLADWVIDMDDGSLTILGIVDGGPTGHATRCGTLGCSAPGRGAANSLNALLDAWELTDGQHYLAKATEIIHRCIHPADDLDNRNLLCAEKWWSYPMFLCALVRYLDLKCERRQFDDDYAYGHASLLHYAEWMVGHERPYLDHPEELEYPTETWPAQEFRKANALRLAAKHCDGPWHARILRQADSLASRAWKDFLGFDTRQRARAAAVVMTEGLCDLYFRLEPPSPLPRRWDNRDVGAARGLVCQKERVCGQVRTASGAFRLCRRLLTLAAWRHAVRQLMRHVPY